MNQNAVAEPQDYVVSLVHEEDLAQRILAQLNCQEDATYDQVVGALYGIFRSSMLSVIYRIGVSNADAEDVYQEAMINLFTGLPSFRGDISSLKTWLYRIVTNEALDYLRKRRTRCAHLFVDGNATPGDRLAAAGSLASLLDTVPDGSCAERELLASDQLEKILAPLSQDQRMLLYLMDGEEFSVEEVAEMTGLNENTIKVKVFRARVLARQIADSLDASARPRPKPQEGQITIRQAFAGQ